MHVSESPTSKQLSVETLAHAFKDDALGGVLFHDPNERSEMLKQYFNILLDTQKSIILHEGKSVLLYEEPTQTQESQDEEDPLSPLFASVDE